MKMIKDKIKKWCVDFYNDDEILGKIFVILGVLALLLALATPIMLDVSKYGRTKSVQNLIELKKENKMEDYNGSTKGDIMKAIADMQQTIVELTKSVEDIHIVIEAMNQPDRVDIDSDIVNCLNGNVDRILEVIRTS